MFDTDYLLHLNYCQKLIYSPYWKYFMQLKENLRSSSVYWALWWHASMDKEDGVLQEIVTRCSWKHYSIQEFLESHDAHLNTDQEQKLECRQEF